MKITEFDAATVNTLRPALLACVGIPEWVDGVLAARPYLTREALLVTAEHLAERWTPGQVDAALADHPRIGERLATQDARAAHSAREQGSLDLDDDIQARLVTANRAYEERFGRVFLIRAAGRTSEEILAEAERRLDNDPITEQHETADQLQQIALLRLAGLVEEEQS